MNKQMACVCLRSETYLTPELQLALGEALARAKLGVNGEVFTFYFVSADCYGESADAITSAASHNERLFHEGLHRALSVIPEKDVLWSVYGAESPLLGRYRDHPFVPDIARAWMAPCAASRVVALMRECGDEPAGLGM